MYRKTYVTINQDVLTENVKEIKKKYSNYEYYFGVVKNNAYHHGMKVVNALKKGGINYFAVSSIEEALEVRKYAIETPILILEPIDIEYIYDCINNNVTITVESLNYAKELSREKLSFELKIHLKLDTGMNRLGFKTKFDLEESIKILKENPKIKIEGLYSHFATSGISDVYWDQQIKKFQSLTENINLSEIPIIHLGRSQTLINHEKIPFCNGIRLGIILYGFSQSQKKDESFRGKLRNWKQTKIQKKYQISKTTIENSLNLKTSFALYSTVLSIHPVKKGEFVGYNADFKIPEDGMIAIIPIGYADGIDKTFQQVAINDKRYQIVADTMDMIMVFTDKDVKEKDTVELFGNSIPIKEVTTKIHKNAYHLFNQIQNRVPRIHHSKKEKIEIKY